MIYNKKAIENRIIGLILTLILIALFIGIFVMKIPASVNPFMKYARHEAGIEEEEEEEKEEETKPLTEEEKQTMALDLFKDFVNKIEECNGKLGSPCRCSKIDFSKLNDYYINTDIDYSSHLILTLKHKDDDKLISERDLFITRIGIWSEPHELNELRIPEFRQFIVSTEITKDFTPTVAYIGKYDVNKIGLGAIGFMEGKPDCGKQEANR